jgi:Arc/MetJ family transcription regulator
MQRTTIRLDEHLLVRVKEFAVRQRKSFTAVVTDALRAHVQGDQQNPTRRHRRVRLPVSNQKGGFAPGIQTWDDVKRVLEQEEIEKFQRVMQEDAARRR